MPILQLYMNDDIRIHLHTLIFNGIRLRFKLDSDTKSQYDSEPWVQNQIRNRYQNQV